MLLREKLKQVRANILGLDPGLLKLYYRNFYSPKAESITARLDQLAKGKKPFYFLQVGGNDGFANDPIFKLIKRHGWRGVIVEPQEKVFKTLLKPTYRFSSKVKLENKAISDETGKRKLYKIAVSESRWATGLATFKKEVLEKQIKEDRIKRRAEKEKIDIEITSENWISWEEVDCITFEDLLAKHEFPSLNLLQIDTEGFDYELIKLIDFSKIKPKIISYENFHLNDEDRQNCRSLLQSNGYKVEEYGGDSLAVIS